MITFGPIPSRRLGSSLGINNVPDKLCSYGCVYCQAGRTSELTIKRGIFYAPQDVLREVQKHLRILARQGTPVDYLSLVPNGEPTLDLNLKETLRKLKTLGFPLAVFTNGTQLSDPEVVEALQTADWVSLKLDTVDEQTWQRLNRPFGKLRLDKLLSAMLGFAGVFRGILTTETMLVKGLNDNPGQWDGVGAFLQRLQPDKSYLAVPCRPPAEEWVVPPEAQCVRAAWRRLRRYQRNLEFLGRERAEAPGTTGFAEADLLATTAVQPLREDAVEKLLHNDHAHWDVIHRLIAEGKLREVRYCGKRYYVRRRKNSSSREVGQ